MGGDGDHLLLSTPHAGLFPKDNENRQGIIGRERERERGNNGIITMGRLSLVSPVVSGSPPAAAAVPILIA